MSAKIVESRKVMEYLIDIELEFEASQDKSEEAKSEAIAAEVEGFMGEQYGENWEQYHPPFSASYGEIVEFWKDDKFVVKTTATIAIYD